MTPAEAIAKLRALLDAATKGTWQHDADEGPSIATGCAEVFIDDEEYGSINVVGLDRSALPQDAKAITASHNVMPALLDVAEAANASREFHRRWTDSINHLRGKGYTQDQLMQHVDEWRAQQELVDRKADDALAAFAKAVEAQR